MKTRRKVVSRDKGVQARSEGMKQDWLADE